MRHLHPPNHHISYSTKSAICKRRRDITYHHSIALLFIIIVSCVFGCSASNIIVAIGCLLWSICLCTYTHIIFCIWILWSVIIVMSSIQILSGESISFLAILAQVFRLLPFLCWLSIIILIIIDCIVLAIFVLLSLQLFVSKFHVSIFWGSWLLGRIIKIGYRLDLWIWVQSFWIVIFLFMLGKGYWFLCIFVVFELWFLETREKIHGKRSLQSICSAFMNYFKFDRNNYKTNIAIKKHSRVSILFRKLNILI